jgi:hypothetical protein
MDNSQTETEIQLDLPAYNTQTQRTRITAAITLDLSSYSVYTINLEHKS